MRVRFILLSLIAIWVGNALADGFEPLVEETWVVNLAGDYSMPDWTINNTVTLPTGTSVIHHDGYAGMEYTITTRDGYFPMDNLCWGGEFSITARNLTFTPDPATTGSLDLNTGIIEEKFTLREYDMFLGPWMRYYIRIPNKDFCFYPEVSVGGLLHSYRREYTDSTLTSYANTLSGIGYNGGLGVALMLDPRFTLDLSFRYEGGSLAGPEDRNPKGKVKDTQIKAVKSDMHFQIGFNLMLGQ